MPGPWEKYQAAAPRRGPWEKYGGDAPLVMDRAAFDRQEGAEPPAPGLGVRVGRQAGLGTRAAVEGISALPGVVYDAAGAVTNLGIMGLNELGADLPYVRRASENVDRVADAAGLPEPQTDNERLMSSAVRGASSSLFFPSPANIGLAALGGVAGEGTYQATGDPLLAAGADLAVNLGGSGAAALTRGAFRGGGQGQAKVQRAVSDFAKAGTSPTLGQATGAKGVQGLESVLAKAPGGAGVMARAAETQGRQVGAKLDTISGGATGEDAGRAIDKGVKDFMARFHKRAEDLYAEVDRTITPNSPVAITSTQGALTRLANPVPSAPEISEALRNPRIQKIAEAVEAAAARNGGQVPYAALAASRTAVGRMLTGGDLVSDVPRAEIKMLYAALSDDMKAAASAAGPDAERAFSRATQFYKSGLGRIDGTLNRLAKIDDPERLAEAVARGDRTTILATRRSMKPDQWLKMAQWQAKNLGLATAGQQNAEGTVTSLDTFLTNWNKLEKPVQDAMFAGIPGNPQMADDLRTIAKVADTVKAARKVGVNASGSGAAVANLSAGAALLISAARGDLATIGLIGSGMTAANLSARLMTNPKAVKLLAASTKWPVERLPALAGRLNQLLDEESASEPQASP